jgi:NAD(P)-dependent dehydrogenase (short-subunit alcohol dehydrogenase family)
VWVSLCDNRRNLRLGFFTNEARTMIHRLFDLTGKVALVTGGSKGLGKAMARGLAEAGADVVISSRNEAELRHALDEILRGTSRKGQAIVADMHQRADVQRLAKRSLETMGRVDILVNNAGSNTPQPYDQITDEAWDQLLELNLTSVMQLSRALIPQMKERRWGRIINITSILGFVSNFHRATYSATKAGMIGMTQGAAIDLGPSGITVNCIAPGPILTDLPSRLLTEEQRKRMADRTVIGRWGQPDELIGPVLLLASDAGSYITGETLVVDGGYLAR